VDELEQVCTMLGESNVALLRGVADAGVRPNVKLGDSDTERCAQNDAQEAAGEKRIDTGVSEVKSSDLNSGRLVFDGTALSVRRMQVICLFLVELIREYAVTDPRKCTESLSKRMLECALKATACGGGAEGISLAALNVSFLGTMRAMFLHMTASVRVVEAGIALADIAVRPSTSQKVGKVFFFQACICMSGAFLAYLPHADARSTDVQYHTCKHVHI
jgi:hypothetical protein